MFELLFMSNKNCISILETSWLPAGNDEYPLPNPDYAIISPGFLAPLIHYALGGKTSSKDYEKLSDLPSPQTFNNIQKYTSDEFSLSRVDFCQPY